MHCGAGLPENPPLCLSTTTSMQCPASSSKPRFEDHTIRGGGCDPATRDHI